MLSLGERGGGYILSHEVLRYPHDKRKQKCGLENLSPLGVLFIAGERGGDRLRRGDIDTACELLLNSVVGGAHTYFSGPSVSD